MARYPIPCTTKGRNTEKALAGTLTQMLKASANHSFQSLAVSTMSLLVSVPNSPWFASSSLIRCVAKTRSFRVKNHAVPGPAGSQNHAVRARQQVAMPSKMKRSCQLLRVEWGIRKMP
jgi:hypothetical protein